MARIEINDAALTALGALAKKLEAAGTVTPGLAAEAEKIRAELLPAASRSRGQSCVSCQTCSVCVLPNDLPPEIQQVSVVSVTYLVPGEETA